MPQDDKRVEVETLLLKDIGDLEDMDTFNKRIEAEVSEEKTAFFDMIADIEDVLSEGGVPELEALLEETAFDMSDCSEDDEDCCEDDADGECCSLEGGSAQVDAMLKEVSEACILPKGEKVESTDESKKNKNS
jgi:hypothetical protein